MSPDLRSRAEAALAALERTSRIVGVPAVQGRHLAGPTKGSSIVGLDFDLAGLLRELLGTGVPAQAAAEPATRLPAAPEGISNRFRKLEFDT